MATLEPFTERNLERQPAKPRRYVVFDPSLPAFGVRIEPTGVRTYQLSYRVRTPGRRQPGRLRMGTIGRFGVITLDAARRKARVWLGQAADGVDPLVDRKSLTVRQALATWLEEHVAVRRKPATLRLYRLAETRIVAAVGALPVDQVTPTDVARLHGDLGAAPYMANRVLAVLSSLMTWCERQGQRARGQNPCRGVEKYPERARQRYLSADEYARLGRALRDAERSRSLSPSALLAIRLLLLTGCRPAEILTLRWAYVDLPGQALRLPDSKTGEKTVFLPPEAAGLLKRWPPHADSPFVFPGTGTRVKGEHLVNLAKPWKALAASADLAGLKLYEACRHSFASMSVSVNGHSLNVLGELLGHSQAATTKRYAHLHDAVARQAAGEVGSTIATAMRKRVRR